MYKDFGALLNNCYCNLINEIKFFGGLTNAICKLSRDTMGYGGAGCLCSTPPYLFPCD
jgi:hypothetical protein